MWNAPKRIKDLYPFALADGPLELPPKAGIWVTTDNCFFICTQKAAGAYAAKGVKPTDWVIVPQAAYHSVPEGLRRDYLTRHGISIAQQGFKTRREAVNALSHALAVEPIRSI
jgi:hypothetical protein